MDDINALGSGHDDGQVVAGGILQDGFCYFFWVASGEEGQLNHVIIDIVPHIVDHIEFVVIHGGEPGKFFIGVAHEGPIGAAERDLPPDLRVFGDGIQHPHGCGFVNGGQRNNLTIVVYQGPVFRDHRYRVRRLFEHVEYCLQLPPGGGGENNALFLESAQQRPEIIGDVFRIVEQGSVHVAGN